MASTNAWHSPVLIRGSGDIGSAIALALFREGRTVLLHDSPMPTAMRRGMALTDALFDGTAVLDGVTGRRVELTPALGDVLGSQTAVLVNCAPFDELVAAVTWSAIIDARLHKRTMPEPLRGLAPVTIGVGPNFCAGTNVDFAIETSLDGRMGMVVESGATSPLNGEPLPLGVVGRERFLYAPVEGRLRTAVQIGAALRKGEVIATIAEASLVAPFAGVVRGLTHDGVPVASGTKIAEIDPRGDPSKAFGVGERPRRIAEGVCRALSLASAHTEKLNKDNQ